MSNQKILPAPFIAGQPTGQSPLPAPMPAPQFYQPPTPPPAYPEEAPSFGPSHLWCQMCRETLYQGDRCIEVLFGRVGRGSKSGQAMVVPDERLEREHPGANNPVLCWQCAIPWLDEEIYGGNYFWDYWAESAHLYEPIEEE